MAVEVMKRVGRVVHTYKMVQIGVGQRFDVDVPDLPVMLHAGWIEPEPGELGYVEVPKVARRAAAKQAA